MNIKEQMLGELSVSGFSGVFRGTVHPGNWAHWYHYPPNTKRVFLGSFSLGTYGSAGIPSRSNKRYLAQVRERVEQYVVENPEYRLTGGVPV